MPVAHKTKNLAKLNSCDGLFFCLNRLLIRHMEHYLESKTNYITEIILCLSNISAARLVAETGYLANFTVSI